MIALVQIATWDKIHEVEYDGFNLVFNDYIVVKLDYGLEIARVVDIKTTISTEVKKATDSDEEITIIRKATQEDLEKMPSEKEKQEALNYCYDLIKKLNLAMKLVDVNFSFDGARITFAFVADGRVDFRNLVKELTSFFNKTVRLQQIGIRDEAKLMGDHGRCGRGLCCRNFLNNFTSITSDMVEAQEVGSKNSERLSGICGRLMCCLSYEVEGYKEKMSKMPPLGAKVNVDGQKGTVVAHHVLKESVSVRFPGKEGEDDVIVMVDLNRHKK